MKKGFLLGALYYELKEALISIEVPPEYYKTIKLLLHISARKEEFERTWQRVGKEAYSRGGKYTPGYMTHSKDEEINWEPIATTRVIKTKCEPLKRAKWVSKEES